MRAFKRGGSNNYPQAGGTRPIGALHKRNSRSTWVSLSLCITSASEVKRCWVRSLSYSFHKTPESNKSVDLYRVRYRKELYKGKFQISGGLVICPTPKCRNMCNPHAFLEAKKLGKLSAKVLLALRSKLGTASGGFVRRVLLLPALFPSFRLKTLRFTCFVQDVPHTSSIVLGWIHDC